MAAENSAEFRRKKKKEALALKKRRRNVLIVMGEMVVCLLLSITCYGMSVMNKYNYEELDPSVYKETTHYKEVVQTETSIVELTNEEGEVYETSQISIPVESDATGYRNILVLGLDARSQDSFDERGLQSDVMIIVSVNNATGDIKMVSVLRDTIMKMEDGTSPRKYDKCNGQFSATGNISDVVSMINRNLGLDIDEYVMINWYGVATCINQLGGVEMTIPNEQVRRWVNGYLTETNEKTGIWAPQFEAPGTYLMTGTQAVSFCRIRYGGWNDDGRTANQREVITKMVDKAKAMAKTDPAALIEVAETGLTNVKTNLKLAEIVYLACQIGDYNIVGSTHFPKEWDSGHFLGNYASKYNIADPLVAYDFAQEVKNLHSFLFNDNDYQPSDFINQISYQMTLDRTGQ